MFGNVQETAYDWKFSIFGIPVRVHPLFWVIAALFSSGRGQVDFMRLAIGVACIFVSILVHELGHALTARYFGWPPRILLYHFGGLAFYNPTYGHTPLRSILISLAGPGAGFVLFGLVLAFDFASVSYGFADQISHLGETAIFFLIRINLFWGLINLLPVYPLDGGQVSRSLFTWMMNSGGVTVSLKISILTGAAVAILAAYLREFYIAILFGGLAYQSYTQLKQHDFRSW